jgi:Ca-activated chloride channel family protein
MRYLIIYLLSFLFLGASPEDARKANEAYHAEKYEEAISLYKRAIDDDPQNAKLYYNLASAYAKIGNVEDAIGYFEEYKAMVDTDEERAKADYNIGNIYSKEESWTKAVDYYKKSLRYMANDPDAKHNYELALKKIKENENQQQKNKDQQRDQDQNQDQKENEKEQQENQQQDQEQQQNQQQDQSDQQNNKQKQKRQQQITPEEAEKILQALGQQEKELLKKFRKQKTESSDTENEKDW